jgi:hypothetical protein
MNAALKTTVFTLTLAAAAAAGPGSILASFLIPGLSSNGPRGLADNGTGYYAVADDRALYQARIIKFTYDGFTASVIASFNCPTSLRWAMDIAWRPGFVYVAEDLTGPAATARIFALNDATGSLLARFNGPYPAGTRLNGLSWDGTYLHASSYDSPWIYRLTTSGAVAGFWAAPHGHNNGLAFGLDKLWVVSTRPEYEVLRCAVGGGVLGSFTFDVNDEYVGGACWGRANPDTVFISTYSGGKYVYEVVATDAGGPAETVTPASLGRVKALFR